MLKKTFQIYIIALFLSNFSYAKQFGEILTAAQQPNLPLLKNKRVSGDQSNWCDRWSKNYWKEKL